ncbi:O-antigen ligase family protein [Phytohabitans kaempferiae]|uniref:O-antigen ligase family protein n=1 Tax=Phytohabitans kaempferiae TaxID=1620943 RepID=A0ABV6MBV5_9ACTN
MTAAVHPVDLEPSLIAPRTYTTRRLRVRFDAAALVSLMVFLLYTLPATLIVPGLTFAGRPALIVGLVLFAWWILARISPWLTLVGPQPLRWACLFYMLSIMLAYLAGLLRGLPTLEANAQNFQMLITAEFLGVVLMAADGIPNWQRLSGVVRVLVWSGGFMAVVGLVQSLTAFDIAQYLTLPGLELKSDLADFQMRGDSGHFRIAGTATHYIEFSTVMAMCIPFGLHFARFAGHRLTRYAFGFVTLLMAAALPMAISRTGVVALAAALLVMFVAAWDWRTRYNMMFVGAAVVGALVILRPGLLGTLKAMFLWAGEDPSIEGRTQDYVYIAAWFAERPWLGRGPGTLIPDLYIILDNQWLMTLVTAGLVGVAALAALHITCISLATIALRRSERVEDRHLCAALISAQVVGILVGFTFDSLSFTTYTFTLALMSGLCGAVWRFTHPARTVRTSTVNRWGA